MEAIKVSVEQEPLAETVLRLALGGCVWASHLACILYGCFFGGSLFLAAFASSAVATVFAEG